MVFLSENCCFILIANNVVSNYPNNENMLLISNIYKTKIVFYK